MKDGTLQQARAFVVRMTMPIVIGWMCLGLVGCGPVAAPLPAPDRVGADDTAPAGRDTLYQTSTLAALSAGAFEGTTSIGQMKRHGDLGLGTFNALDGEMVMIDGQVLQVKVDGKVYAVPDDLGTPFAAVTYFESDRKTTASEPMSCAALEQFIDGWLPATDAAYALRITGTFEAVKARSVPPQSPPNPPLSDVVEHQTILHLPYPDTAADGLRGTMVGFRLPESLANVNSAGYHLHFLTEDRSAGGHVLDCRTLDVTVEADLTDRLEVLLPSLATASE